MNRKGEIKQSALVLYRAYGQMIPKFFLAPGSASKFVKQLKAQGYDKIQYVPVSYKLEI
jgi:hypothetical protein